MHDQRLDEDAAVSILAMPGCSHCAGRLHYFQVQKLLLRLAEAIPHLRSGEPLPRVDDGDPQTLQELLALDKQTDYAAMTSAEWRIVLRPTLKLQVHAHSLSVLWHAHLRRMSCLSATCCKYLLASKAPLLSCKRSGVQRLVVGPSPDMQTSSFALQLLGLDIILGVVHRQVDTPHALLEGPPQPLPMETLAYGAPSAGVIKVHYFLFARRNPSAM